MSLSWSVQTVPFCSANNLLKRLMLCVSIPQFSSALHQDWWLMESNAIIKSTVSTTFWHPPPCISVPICMLQDDPAFGKNVQVLPGLLIALGRVCCKVFCIWLLRTACEVLAECKLGGNYQLLPHFLLFVDHFYAYCFPSFWCAILLLPPFVWRYVWPFFSSFRRKSWRLRPGFCVLTCFAFFVAFNGSLYFIFCELWHFIYHVFVTAFLLGVVRVVYFISKLIFGRKLAVEFTDICYSFSWCDCLAFLVFHFLDERAFPFRFNAWSTFDACESSKNRCIFSCRFVLFRSLMHFLILLLNSFSLCFLLSQCFASPQWVFWSHRLLHWSFHFFCSCDLDLTSVLSAFSLAAAAFVSSPRLRVAVASATNLLSASTTSLPDRVFTAAVAFVSSFQSSSACFDIVK